MRGKRRKKRENNNSGKEMKEEHIMTWRVVDIALVTIVLQILCRRGKGICVSVPGAKKKLVLSLSFRSLSVRVSKSIQIIHSHFITALRLDTITGLHFRTIYFKF